MILNQKQQEIFNYIKKYIDDRGFPPSIREVCKAAGFSSPRAGQKYLEALEQKPGTLAQVTLMMKTINQFLNEKDARGKIQFLAFMKKLVDRSLQKMDPQDL